MFFKSLMQLEQDWQRSYMWDFHIPSYGESWLPATDIEENLSTLNSKEFNFYTSTFKVPQSSSAADLKITYINPQNNSLSQFFADWVNQKIFGNGKYVLTVEESVRPCIVMKLNHARQPIKITKYQVYPEGESYYRGDSESGLAIYTQDFVIAGTL